MKLSLVKKIIQTKLASDKKIAQDDELVADALYEAIYFICSNIKPSELTREFGDPEIVTDIIRHIEGGSVIVAPEYPDFTNTDAHLQIDETLTYAAIYIAMSYLATDGESVQKFGQRGEDIMATYNANQSLILYADGE